LGGRAAEGGFRSAYPHYSSKHIFLIQVVADDRPSFPPREDLPLPTQPPFTAFVGNLAFDLTESELGDYFTPLRVCIKPPFLQQHLIFVNQVKSVKIIKDREDKPKGFGYVEFESVDDLKEALGKSGSVK
jgi:translation initiation factor 4B